MKTLEQLGIRPAPWRIVDSYQFPKDGEWVSVIEASNKTTVSVPAFCNARLIAAAPKLYEALREAIAESCISYCGESPIHCPKKPGECFVQKWRAALAEAAGEEVSDGGEG